MRIAEERALIADIGDKLLDLYAKRDEALSCGDLDRVYRLQAEINNVAAERSEIIRGVEPVMPGQTEKRHRAREAISRK
jgi:hypothetical protein